MNAKYRLSRRRWRPSEAGRVRQKSSGEVQPFTQLHIILFLKLDDNYFTVLWWFLAIHQHEWAIGIHVSPPSWIPFPPPFPLHPSKLSQYIILKEGYLINFFKVTFFFLIIMVEILQKCGKNTKENKKFLITPQQGLTQLANIRVHFLLVFFLHRYLHICT